MSRSLSNLIFIFNDNIIFQPTTTCALFAVIFCALSVAYGKDQHGVVLDAPLRTLTQLRHRK